VSERAARIAISTAGFDAGLIREYFDMFSRH
jgi:hypothetical protein